jgi:hypothetical protein
MVANALDAISHSYLFERAAADSRPSPARLEKSASVVRSGVKRAVAKLKDNGDSLLYHLEPYVILNTRSACLREVDQGEGRVGQARIDAAISVLDDLVRWCEAAERVAARQKGTGKRHIGDPAMDVLIENLGLLYFATWACNPSVSNSADEPEPFIRFALRYFAVLSSRLSDEFLQKSEGLRKALDPTPSAIRNRVKKWELFRFAELKSASK